MASTAHIDVRKPAFDFAALPRDWLAGQVVPTHLANALNLLFPLGERFFVRSVKHYADRIDDPALLEAVRGFMGQEVRHGMSHEAAFEQLEAQGYEIQSFLKWYDEIAYGLIERKSSPALRLSVTVALEHFTAMFAERVLRERFLEERAHPIMKRLLMWHACEELEHKSVAFDVLKRVNPSWALRTSGLVLGASALVFFWIAGTRHLLKQEPPERRRGLLKQLLATRKHNSMMNGALLGSFLRAMRPSFHPTDVDDAELAADWLEANAGELGLA